MFKGTEPSKFISLAYLTGILPIKKLKTQSALNNFTQYTMLNPGPFAEYIGFTELSCIQSQCRCQFDAGMIFPELLVSDRHIQVDPSFDQQGF